MLLTEAITLVENRDYNKLEGVKIDIPEHFNWAREVFESVHVKRHSSKTALLWADQQGNERAFTFGDFVSRGNRFLNLLRRAGLRKGDPIFVMVPVYPEVWLSYFAAIKGGFVLVPAAMTLTERDIEYRFGQLPPSAVVADSASAATIEAAERAAGREVTTKIIVGRARSGWINFDDAKDCSDEAEAGRTRSDDRLFIFFTSGTTGPPKMVLHTHVSYPVGHLTTAAWIGIKSSDTHYNMSQPGWAKFAWSSFFAPWNVGATTVGYHYLGRFVAREHLEVLQKNQVTTFCAPPTVWRMLILEDLSRYNFKLREVVSAGEPLNPEVIVSWREKTGLTIRDGYGQTESTLMVGNLPETDVKLGSMGRPTFLYDITIVDDEGKEVPPNREGNIAVKLQSRPIGLFTSYIGVPKDTVSRSIRGGLYYTGDKAYRDNEGRLWFVGRSDDVIKASDYRIGPFEVESVLIEHPAVAEAAVVGSPHALRGNMVKAFVVLQQNHVPSEELAHEIFNFSRERLAHYKAPRILEFTAELPKTSSGKIRRIELRAKEVESKQNRERGPDEYYFEELTS